MACQIRQNVGLDGAKPGRAQSAAVREFGAVATGAERKRNQVVDMRDDGSAELRVGECGGVGERVEVADEQPQGGRYAA